MKLFKTLLCAATALVVGASAQAATTLVPGVVKQEVWFGGTLATLEAGTLPASTNVAYLNVWEHTAKIGDNYAERLSGVIIPPTTGAYDFYLAADDDSDLFLSTDSSPTNKVKIAAEPSWAGVRAWTGNTQRSSLTWTNTAGATPFASGISLVAGTRYFLEVDHHQGGGGDNLAVTAVPHGTAIVNGDATTLTGSVIGFVITTPTSLSFTLNPSNTTDFVGTSLLLNVATATDSVIPPTYQWRRGGSNIPGANAANYTLLASAADSGATFNCVATVPGGLSATSTVATVTVTATGALTVNGYLKREVFAGYTTDNVRTNVNIGNVGEGVVTAVNQFDVPSAGANYAERVSGYFTPTNTGLYVFFLAADDDTDLYLSTDAQPANRRLIAQETVWSNNRDWISSGGASDVALKRSDQFSPDGFITQPYATGISLTAGTKYYIEAVHRAGGGGNGVSATYIIKGDLDPTNGTPSVLTNGLISYVTAPVTRFSIAPLANVSVFEGLNYKFAVNVTTDSEVSPQYQWRRGGVPIVGANGSTLSGPATLADSGSTFSVDVSIPGVTNATSTTATLTVQQSVFASGTLKLERWNSTVLTRAIIGANAPGTVPEADVTKYVTSGFDVLDAGSDYLHRLSGFFVPATAGNYVFYLAADDDTDLFLSTDATAANKRLIAQEGGWSADKSWNTIGGGSTIGQRRSDQWSPDAGATVPYAGGIALTAGTRYYIEAVHHQGGGGQNLAVTFTKLGDADPVNGSATKLVGNVIGVLVPAATALNMTQDVASVSTYVTQPAAFTVGATNNGLLPTTYQWRRNGTNLVGATSAGYNLVTSTGDNGAKFSCVMSVPGTTLSVTSSVATLTITAGGTLVSGQLATERWDGGQFSVGGIESGNGSLSTVQGTLTNLDQSLGINDYVLRVRGYFIPATTAKYVFFVTSDDDSDLFLSTDDQPSNKRLIAHQSNWANPDQWLSTGSGNVTEIAQKRSDQWVPDPANPPVSGPPYATGISLTAGQHYYIESVMHQGGGGDNLGVTFKFSPTDVTLAPDPTNGSPSIVTGSVIGYLSAPAGQQLSIVQSGNSVNVSWTPPGGRLQSTPALGASPVWTDLGAANPKTITVAPGNLFLRVVTP